MKFGISQKAKQKLKGKIIEINIMIIEFKYCKIYF